MVRITTAVALALIALLTGLVPAAWACKPGNQPPNAQAISSARRTLVCLINRERRQHRLRVVRGDLTLGAAAQEHSDAMVAQNFFAHDGVDGTPASRASWAGYIKAVRAWGIGETLGFGTGPLGSSRAIFKAWMRSPEHRPVILDGSWRQIGVGVTLGSPLGADGQGMATYTVNFGYRRG